MTEEQEKIILASMQHTSMLIRGLILDIFTVIEFLMDDIIAKTTFDTESEYDKFMAILEIRDLRMSVKKRLFKICIEKYETKYSKDLTLTKNNIDCVVEKRNVVAHYQVDTSDEGMALFINKQTIRYMALTKDRKSMDYDSITKEESQKIRDLIFKMQFEIIEMKQTIDSSLAQ